MEDGKRWERAGIGQVSRVIKNINAQSVHVWQERSEVGVADEGFSYFGSGRCLYICLVSPLWLEKGTLVLGMILLLHPTRSVFQPLWPELGREQATQRVQPYNILIIQYVMITVA